MVRLLKLLQKRVLNQKGFTLLESLLVLFIVSTMSLILITNIAPIYHKKVIETFLNQFEKDMLYAQQYALVNEELVFVLFKSEQNLYKIESNEQEVDLLTRNYHPKIKIEGATLTNKITYISNGSIQKSGTMFISYKDSTYKVIFYLGKGRFNIEKL
ncbi:type II secretion system protein [Metabacillus sediminilitoris]|uniref:Type II secretion system protein n=1 Tax=Metabacillus sediminilitoris TaxID=2567941 RepID=A0A4S4BZ63_9BACI|nr:prepilin-type N-terminal cleavage/methylation domain-containing protein [Metabacillus sediminilitoris]THF80586.1 type II secretion system protein [Metabacillus sediminilitoris]